MMKKLVIISLWFLAGLIWATPGTITDLHAVPGDSGLFRRNIDTVEVNLNINGTHVWDFTDDAISYPEIDERDYTKNRDEGMFGYMFPEASLVSQNFSVLDTMESYFNKTEDGFFAYGFTIVVFGQATPSRITQGGPARLMLFPSTLGDTWLDNYVMTSGIASIYTLNFVEVVDTGQVLTELNNFPCVVVRMYQDIEVKIGGITILRMHFYRYDWYVDSLTSVASIQSRNDETNPIFTEAVRVSRVKELSYYQQVEISEGQQQKPRHNLIILPSSKGLSLKFNLPSKGELKLNLYDLLGRQAATKKIQVANPGENEIQWDLKLAKGVYFLNFKTGQFKTTEKVVIFRND
jgi:hypothetical protein